MVRAGGSRVGWSSKRGRSPRGRGILEWMTLPSAFDLSSTDATEEHQLLRATIADFTREKIEPQADHHDRSGSFNRRLFEECAKLGLLGITVPIEDGGGGMDSV